MAIKVGSNGPKIKTIKIGSPETIVKKITVGVPQSVAASGSFSIHNMTGVNTTARENGHILIWDSSDNKYVTSKIVDGTGIETLYHPDSDTLIIGVNGLTTTNVSEGTNLYYTRARMDSDHTNVRTHLIPLTDSSYDLGDSSKKWRNLYLSGSTIHLGGLKIKDSSAIQGKDIFSVTDSAENPVQFDLEGSKQLVRSYLSAAGDLTYDASTGQFSFDVEQVYTKENWDSDLGLFTSSGGEISLIDDAKITFGNDSDLKIYHNGSHSIIEDAGTGSLQLRSNNLSIQNAAGTENQLTALSGGAVTLHHNNNSKLATTIYGATVTGTINADSATLTNLTADSATITNINRSGTTVTPGIYGTAVKIPRLTIDSSGFIDSAGTVDVAGVSSVSFDSATYNYTINTADGGVFTQMIHTRKPGLAAGTHGSEVLVPQITINEYGLVDSIGTTQVAGVSSTAWDSATGVFTINTADGNAFATTVIMDSDWTKNRVRSSLSASGDLTYDSNTGQFSFDVEQVYTKANFDSDFNVALDSAVLEGVGLKYNNATNTLDIDSAELEAYYKQDIRGYFSASNSLGYNSSTGDFRLPQPLDSAATPTFNQLRGPAEFLIDPAAIGDSTGTVRILGNLRVDGVQTTINSTAVSVADKNIIIADSAADSAGLNGGGFTWGGDAIVDNPTFTYSHSNARLVSNRNIQATTFVGQISDISNHSTTDLSEGSNLYYTTARADSAARNALMVVDAGGDGSFTYDSALGKFTYTGPNSTEVRAHFSAVDSGGDGAFSYEQATGKFIYRGPNSTEVRAHFSAVDSGGDGAFSYEQATGKFIYRGPSASEVRAHFTANKGLSVTSGEFNIDSANVRGMFSGQGDLSYDSSTGVFSINVETVYTSSNFDSDLLDAGYDDLDHSLLVDSSVAVTSNLSLKPIDFYSSTTYRSSKYLIQATKGSKYQVSEILLTHDGSTPHMTEYGKICIGDSSLATYDARITGGSVILEARPVEATTTFKYHRTLIKV